MSQFKDDFTAALEKVAAGRPENPETKAALDKLNELMTNNDATDAEQSEAILALTTKLAESTPPTA